MAKDTDIQVAGNLTDNWVMRHCFAKSSKEC